MIIDQLFENNKKPLKEGGPYDLPGIDYDRPGDTPPKRRSAPSDYPYSQEQDDDYFREIFRKKREAAKKAEQDKDQGVAEEQVYESFYKVGRMLVERKMSEKEILDVFAQAEQGMTNKDTGANRTMLGRGKDTVGRGITSATDAITKVMSSIQNSAPVAGVDVAYDQATDALANAVGPNSKVMDSINKYRLLAKEYPKTQFFVKTALIALAGLATGGAALPVIAGLTAAVDAAIKGEKLSSILGKGVGAGVMGLGAEEVSSMLSSTTGAETLDPGAVDAGSQGNQLTPQQQLDAGVDKFEIDAALDWVNDDPAGKAEIEKILQLTPDEIQKIADSNLPRLGGTGSSDVGALADPTSTPGPGAEGFGGGTYTTVDGDQGGYIAQANGISFPDLKGLNPQVTNWDKLPIGTELQLPQSGPNTGSVWDGGATGAGGKQFNLPAADAAQNAAADAKAAADYAAAGPAEKAEILKTTGTPPAAAPSQSGPIYRSPMQMTTQVAGIPVIPGQPLNPTQMMVADFAMQQGNQLSPVVQAAYDLAKRGAVRESVRFKKLPAEQMIDQKLTVLSWALNESVNRKSNSVSLTNKGVYTVFENIDRYRKAIVEYTEPGREQIPNLLRPDAPGAPVTPTAQPGMIGRGLNALDRGVKGLGGWLSNKAHQFTTGVTKEKLKMNWHQAGKPTDSDQLAAWLVTQKVPQDVVTDVFSKMGIPYTAPSTTASATASAPAAAKTGGAQRQAYAGNNPATGKPWTVDELQARMNTTTTAPAPTDTTEPTTTKTAPTTTTTAGGPGFNAGNVMNLPGMEKYAKKPATPPAKTPNFAGPGGYGKTTMTFKTPGTAPVEPKPPAKVPTQAEKDAYIKSIGAEALPESRIATALKKPVDQMLQMVETKEDVQRIKQFVDDTFVKHGAVTESAFAVRNKIIEHVTQVGAQRRREYARKGA